MDFDDEARKLFEKLGVKLQDQSADRMARYHDLDPIFKHKKVYNEEGVVWYFEEGYMVL